MSKHEDCQKDSKVDSTDFRAHLFPCLQQEPVTDRTGKNTKVHFQPMFHCGTSGYSPAFACEHSEDDDVDEALCEDARQKGYQKGFDAGKMEACQRAREALQPDLIDFLQAFENVSAFHQHVTETASHQIIQMAVRMCEQVLGQSVVLETKEADTLRQELQDAIGAAHHLTLVMNTDDTKALQDLTACFNLTWPEHGAVTFQTESHSSRGSLHPAGDDRQKDALRRFLDRCMSEPKEAKV
jgi:hypothetical protein